MRSPLAIFDTIREELRSKFPQILRKREVRLPEQTVNEMRDEVIQIVESSKPVYDAEITSYSSQIGRLQADVRGLQAMTEDLKVAGKALADENLKLKNRIKALEEVRSKFTPEELSLSLKDAMKRMEEGLRAPSDSGVAYTVSDFDIELKANVSVEDQKVVIRTPAITEEVPASSISTLRLKVSKEPAVEGEKRMIVMPNLIGSTKESAVNVIESIGLKLAKLDEKESTSPAKTVIAQDPEPFSKVELGFPVSLVISMEMVSVPNLVGMTQDDVVKLLTKLELRLGKVTREPSDAKPGIVLSQSIKPESKVRKGTIIDIVISSKKTR